MGCSKTPLGHCALQDKLWKATPSFCWFITLTLTTQLAWWTGTVTFFSNLNLKSLIGWRELIQCKDTCRTLKKLSSCYICNEMLLLQSSQSILNLLGQCHFVNVCSNLEASHLQAAGNKACCDYRLADVTRVSWRTHRVRVRSDPAFQ